ncbi:AI-2E family transporter [Nanoarchaeota archaeon]
MRDESQRFHKTLAAIVLVVLVGFLLWALFPFFTGIFGALILFTLFNPLYKWFKKKNMNESLASVLVIVLSFIIIVIPLITAGSLLVGEVNSLLSDKEKVTSLVQGMDELLVKVGIQDSVADLVSDTGSLIQRSIFPIIESITSIAVNLIIMFFLLFYLFINGPELKKKIHGWIPFGKKNSAKLVEEFRSVTGATLFSTALVSLIQALLLMAGFIFFGIKGAILWGFVGFIFALLPVFGISLIWVPTGIIFLSQGNYYVGIGILVWGAFLSTVDNFLRPWIGKKFSLGHIHPLTILIGIFIGIPYFGILGVVVGPLLLSYFFTIWKLFNEEYIK